MVTGMLKLTMRQIRSSLTRFLAIAAIVALGVGFFCGLRLTKTAMVHTLDDYAEAHRMYDFRLVSTVGFDETDAEALAADARVAACEGEKSADALASVADGAAKPCRFLSLPEQIDLPGLKCGRFPQTSEECLADGLLYSEKDLGKTVVLTEENDEDTLDGFNRREFTIVGIAKSVLYINYERGGTSIGSGTLSSFVYILPEAFALEYDTSLYLRLPADRARSIPTNIPPALTLLSRGSRSLPRARLMGAAIASMKRPSRRSPTRVKRWMKSSRSWPMQSRSLPTRSRSWKTRIRRMLTALFLWPTQSRRRSRNWPTHTRSWWMGSGRSRKMNRSWPMANRSWQTAKKS